MILILYNLFASPNFHANEFEYKKEKVNMKNNLKKFIYGGDYNPEQWSKTTWQKDLQAFQQAKINSVTLNVFSWALLEKQEGNYDFAKLDQIIKMFSAAHFQIILATATAAMPAWMFQKYPDVARVDFQGRRHVFGQRHNFCPNSPNYQRLAEALVDKLAARYAKNSNIVAWHVNNEYGGDCYCQNCQRAFQKWLQQKYRTLENLNHAWNMNFWSHTIYAWNQITVPNELGDGALDEHNFAVSGLAIDYCRFQSDSLLRLFQQEKKLIEHYNDHVLITTNFHSTPNKSLDYFKWAKSQDIISYDSYPAYDTPAEQSAFLYDLMRGLKNGQPFMLMESTPSQVNWQPYSPLKRPGQLAAQEFQAIAHGANTIQYFQLKQSLGAQEKFHGAVIAHSGQTNTRVFKEVKALGKLLEKFGSNFLQATVPAKVAIIFDWTSYWALSYAAGINHDLDYLTAWLDYYRACYQLHLPVDVTSVEADLSHYQLVIAPLLYAISNQTAQKLQTYVENGGTLITTYASGIADENDLVYPGGYPGLLKKMLGIWVEESDAIIPGKKVTLQFSDHSSGQADLLCDLIHPLKAHVLATYTSEFYQGTAAITSNSFGRGQADYFGCCLDDSSLQSLIKQIAQKLQLKSLSAYQPTDLDLSIRQENGCHWLFIINLTDLPQPIPQNLLELNAPDLLTGKLPAKILPSWGISILQINN
jgi:beta-galactosidase